MAREEAVIVVVGGETEYKARVAEALANGRGASEAETMKGGVRIFRKESSPDAVVIDTTPLVVYEEVFALSVAEMWISLNALRRLYGKRICVICVVPSSGPEDSLHCESDFPGNKFNWLHLLGYIFPEHKRNILLLVKLLEGTNDSEALRSGVTDALEREGYIKSNISFENMMVAEDLIPTVRARLERSVFHCKSTKENASTTIHFRLKEVTSTCKNRDRYGCWGPERVILLGRTGSGKSTLYQMLTKGRLDPSSKSAASSSIRGETKEVTRGEGRGWYVIDTPGFGELKDKLRTISTEEAQKRIERYVAHIEGTYSHFIYVVMKDRIDTLEKTLWKFFQTLFAGGENFTVVISNANQTWVDQNISALQTDFVGCKSFLSGEFPPTATNDPEWEAELEEVRAESLRRLEGELASLSRRGTDCEVGGLSRRTLRRISYATLSEIRQDKSEVFKAIVDPFFQLGFGGVRIAAGAMKSFELLSKMLQENKQFVLLPP